MAARLPQPPHGWGALIWEVGVVVVGVLIALGAQSIADDLHWKDAVEQEKADLDRDVRLAWDATSARRVAQPCISRRLADIGRVIERHQNGQPLGIIGPIGRSTVWSAGRSGLAMASSDGTLAHLPVAKRSAYFQIDYQAQEFQRAVWEERDAWRALSSLNHAASRNSEGWQRILDAYQDALDSDRVMRTNLVPDYEDGWLSSFSAFPPMQLNKEELTNPLTQALCKTAVTP